MPNSFKLRLAVLALAAIIIAASVLTFSLDDDDEERWVAGDAALADEYMVFVDAPESAEDMALIYALSCLAVRNGNYHPLFILDETGLDEHQLWTIEHSTNRDVEKYLFTNSAPLTVAQQLRGIGVETNIICYNFTKWDVNKALRGFLVNPGPNQFSEEIKVASHHEALWVAPLAAHRDAIVTLSKHSSFNSQERVWEALADEGLTADYVLAANPDDYLGDDVFHSVFNAEVTSYHYRSISAVAAEIAAYRRAFVVTEIEDLEDIEDEMPEEYTALYPEGNPELGDLEDEANDMYLNNVKAYGYYEKFLEINDNYGPTKYLCLVGGAEALPQFELYDYSMSEGNLVEPKIPEYTSSDTAFGFLDQERLDYMTTAVGRIINYNVQGASN
ncbi:MAG: hypothetical protein KAU14_00105, partial [Thermoplasmata archaeon]|nr:hypothetical protein [Thermoplasmata archaeon]